MRRAGLRVAIALAGGLACLSAAVVAPPALAQADEPRLDELLRRPAFREAWDRVFRRERNVDRWVHVFAGGGEGTVLPGRAFARDGQRYVVGIVCRPHDCADNRLFVLFKEDGSQAWARLVAKDIDLTFGQPAGAIRALLVEVAGR